MSRFILLLLSVLLLFFRCATYDTITITDLKCEYLSNPLGIDSSQPRLSWQLESNLNGQKQTAYQILASSSLKKLNENMGDLWDSGKIASDRSIQVVYSGKKLSSRQRVYWKVRIWDTKGKASSWSKISWWEMGLLQANDWQANWIGSPEESDSFDVAPLFRKEFIVKKPVRQARVYVSGLGYFEFYLNGKKAGDHVLSPNQTNYDRRQVNRWAESRIGNMGRRVLYETFDITNLLKSGDNAAGVWLGAGWYRQNDRVEERSLWYDSPRFIAQIEIEYDDGSRETITSDESWSTAQSPILHNGLHSGEIYDARLEQPGWDRPGFDDADWDKAVKVRPPEGPLQAQMSPPDRVIKTIEPVNVEKLNSNSYRFDLGQMISGWARLRVAGPAGTRLVLRFREELGPTYGQTDTYILKGTGEEIWEPRFTWHAFRYVEVSGSPTPLTAHNLSGRVVNTNVDTSGFLECSNPLFNRILQNYRWTQLGNMHGGVPSDSPHRERRGYTGDGQISSRAALFNFDMAAFYTKWMNDIADAQNSLTGYVPNTAPYQDGGGGTAWGSAVVIIPWNMYLFYGDKQILERHYERMKKWVQYLDGQRNNLGLLENQGLGEWVPPDPVELPTSFVNTSYFYYNADLLAKIAGILDAGPDSVYFENLKGQIQQALVKNYYRPNRSCYATGAQGANAFPLGFGYAPEEQRQRLLSQLVSHIETTCRGHFDTGILATPLQLDVLSDNGAHEWAYTLMERQDYPGFGHMISSGATTLWETWQGDASHSHPMFGSVCQWFYQKLAGINPDPGAPGFKHIILKPMPVSGLTFVKAGYKSPYGLIKSEWQTKENNFNYSVTVPVNSTATVYVPALSQEKVSVQGRNAGDLVTFLEFKDHSALYKIQSGKYSFVSKGCASLFPRPALPSPVITPADTMAFAPDSVRVEMESLLPDADIFYTLDASEPTETSQKYRGPFFLNHSAEIKARLFKKGWPPGFVKRRIIRFVDPDQNGVTYKYFAGEWEMVPDFSKLEAQQSGRIFQFDLNEINFPEEKFALRFKGKIQITTNGEYTFWTSSNDGSRLYINDCLIVDNDGLHGSQERSGSIPLSPGRHKIRLDYFQAGGGLFLKVWYAGPGIEKQEISPAILYRE